MAICAVSWSRISPTRTTSGSHRRIDRKAPAKVRPAFGLTCTWLMPASRYSTGSSTVMTLISGRETALSVAYKVVDLPEPVGPVTSIMPYGLVYDCSKTALFRSRKPRSERSSRAVELSKMRITTFSPQTVGKVATRRSIFRPWWVTDMRPSCGFRRSAMSISLRIFTREITPAWICFGDRWTSLSTPSIRYRTRRSVSVGSMWMSDARSWIAWLMRRLTKRTIGASSSTNSPTLDRSPSTFSVSSKEDWRSSISLSDRQYRSMAWSRSSRVATTGCTWIPVTVSYTHLRAHET